MKNRYTFIVLFIWSLLSGCVSVNDSTPKQTATNTSITPCYDPQRDLSKSPENAPVYWCGQKGEGSLPQSIVYLNSDGTLHDPYNNGVRK